MAAARLVCSGTRGAAVRLGLSETHPAHANASARPPPTARRVDNFIKFEKRILTGSGETGAEAVFSLNRPEPHSPKTQVQAVTAPDGQLFGLRGHSSRP